MPCSEKHFTVVMHFAWKVMTAQQFTESDILHVVTAERHWCQTILLTLQKVIGETLAYVTLICYEFDIVGTVYHRTILHM